MPTSVNDLDIGDWVRLETGVIVEVIGFRRTSVPRQELVETTAGSVRRSGIVEVRRRTAKAPVR